MLDTGCNFYSTIGEKLVTAAQIASVRKTIPDFGTPRSISGLGGTKLRTIGKMKFYFLFG